MKKKHAIFSQGLLLGGDDFTGAGEKRKKKVEVRWVCLFLLNLHFPIFKNASKH